MFKRVESKLELDRFNYIWTTVWMEKGYELEYSDQSLERFVVISEEGEYVGTTEVKPYSIYESAVNQEAAFADHPKLILAEGAVAEIDKMAVLKEHRGHFIADLLSAVAHFGEKNQLRYYVALLEPVFLRALRITFQVPYEKIGNKIFYKGDYVIPVIIDVEEVYNNKEHYSWITYPNNPSYVQQTTS